MAYTVSGTLKLPDGTAAAGVDLRFVALTTFSPLIESAEQTVRTGANGSYSIALETSSYNVFVTYNNNRPFLAGRIVINSNTAPGQDLPTLLGGTYQPATPDWIQQVEAWLTQAQGSATAAASSASFATTEANRSRTEADRSKSEADRASQISGLSTVADAIGLAALPMPDVWAPLSDSLRMITGYGRDVLVGSDVVARMVNFSRNSTATYIGKDGKLKTAAANEPRFEKEGLLIEGQSTNLFPWSQEFIGKWGRVDAIASPDSNFPNAVALNGGAAGYVHTSVGNLTIGAAYTITAIVTGYVEGATQLRGRFANSHQESNRVVGQYGPYTVLSFRTGSAANSNPNVTGIYWDAGYANGVTLCAMQIEALPFASSYIPTNGAAVTRAADIVSITPVGNFVKDGTWSFEVVNARATPASPGGRIFWGQGASNAIYGARISMDASELAFFGGTTEAKTIIATGVSAVTGVVAFSLGRGCRFGQYLKNIPAWGGGINLTSINIGSDASGLNNCFCHVRNLRGYLRSLSDTQLKAIV